MTINSCTLFDTDLQIHRLSSDPPVNIAASKEFIESRPSAMSMFSMLELKGNYIQSLILLHRKISDSDSIEIAHARIQNTGGRKAVMMFYQLIKILGVIESIHPWNEAKNFILTILDSQIGAVWMALKNSVDFILDDFNCTRAEEAPNENNGKWTAHIPKCRDSNTKCNVEEFLLKYSIQLKNLIEHIIKLPEDLKTKELDNIFYTVKDVIRTNRFSKEKWDCRKIGDLLIGLQCKVTNELLSSNYKEHDVLSIPLEYSFRKFPIAEIRSK